VVISDTMGRAWRNGLTDVALGAAGIEPFRDHRGEIDPYGNELELTQMAVIDELAAAGELVKGKCDQVPVAVVRGYPRAGLADHEGAIALVRDAASDMFSLGTAEARAAGLRDAALLPQAPPGNAADEPTIDRAWSAVAPLAGPSMIVTRSAATITCRPRESSPTALMLLGEGVHRLRAALAAEGLASSVSYSAEAATVTVSAG